MAEKAWRKFRASSSRVAEISFLGRKTWVIHHRNEVSGQFSEKLQKFLPWVHTIIRWVRGRFGGKMSPYGGLLSPLTKKWENVETLVWGSMLSIWAQNCRNSHFSCPRSCDGNSGQIRAGSPRCHILAEKRGLYITEMRSPDNFHKTCQNLYLGFIWAYNDVMKPFGLNRIDFRGRKPNLLVKATNRRNVRGSHETRYLGS